ncbi:MAG: acyl carrier protein [Sulfurifustis sp.]
MSHIETIVRESLCKTLKRPPSQAGELKLEESLAYAYGLTSLDLIMLMTAVCSTAGVPLTEFTEDDIAQVRTPADIVNLLRAKTPA